MRRAVIIYYEIFFETYIVKYLALVNWCLFVFLIFPLSFSCVAGEIEISVTTSADRMGFGSVFAKDAAYFTIKGTAKLAINSRVPLKPTGSICCHVGERTEEVFLKTSEGTDLLLQVKKSLTKGSEGMTAAIYDVAGKLSVGPIIIPIAQHQIISASPSKMHFAILSDNIIMVYDSGLNLVNKYKLEIDLKKVSSVALSNTGSSALIKDSKSIVFVDFKLDKEVNINSCNIPRKSDVKLASYEDSLNNFVVISESGASCFINQGEVESFKLDNTWGLKGVYATDLKLYIVRESSIHVVDKSTLAENEIFDLTPYYEEKFGTPSSNEWPMFSAHEFDSKNNTFYLRGHASTRVFYQIKILGK